MNISRRNLIVGSIAVASATTAGCARTISGAETLVEFERFEPGFDHVIDTGSVARLISTGHQWAEGPAWDRDRQTLYFTDVPKNRAYAWSRDEGERIFLDPSGADPAEVIGMREPGANGLILSQSGQLLICNHGARSVQARSFESGTREVLANQFAGKRFNSPNDLIEASDGTIFFTDPPYGLSGLNASPDKEMEINGVYRIDPSGAVDRLVEDMTFPNGAVLSPDEKWLYVSQSDPEAPLIRRFAVDHDWRKSEGGTEDWGASQWSANPLNEEEVWFDAMPYMHPAGGLPDGMAVSVDGHIFLAGPGGVLIIDPNGQCLGRIDTGRASANCAFGEDGQTLFITAKDRVVAVRTKLSGLGRF